MKKCVSTRLLLSALVVACAITACSADVIKPSDLVAPGSPTGWSLVTVSSGNALFTAAPLGCPGTGALWVAPGGDGSTSTPPYPGQIWMGTNAYNGTLLSDITTLTYDTWTSNSGIYKPTGTMLKDRWSGPRQQVTFRMCIDPGNGSPKRMLYFAPRGADYAPFVDDLSHENNWLTNDCLNGGRWYDFQYQVSMGQSTWAEIVARYPNGRIAQPALQVGGAWPEASPPDSPNACGISLEWGAEMYGLNSGYQSSPGSPMYTVPCSKNWWRECLNGIAWVDNVQVGVGGADPTVYDFEPETDPGVVTGSGKSLQALAAYKSCRLTRFDVVGKVANVGGDGEFQVDDGSPEVPLQNSATTTISMDVWCRSIGTPTVSVGDWVRVRATLVPGYSNRWFDNGPIVNRFHTLPYAGFITDPTY